MRRTAALYAISCALLLLSIAAAPLVVTKWSVVGPKGQVQLAGSTIRLTATPESVAGGVSGPIRASSDVLFIRAQVRNAAAQAVTICLNDAKSMPVGYWQNPLPIETPTQVACAIAATPGSDFRLFVGSDRTASSATIENIRLIPARQTFNYRSAIYGAVVDNKHQPAQSIIARGTRLVGISTRLRMLAHGNSGPDLFVRLLPASGNAAVIKEVRIPRHQIPTADVDEAREITIALDAPVKKGETYLIEFAAAGAFPEGQGFLLYAGLDEKLDERLYRNRQTVDPWDLYLQVYESDE
jgi:hypothetical protein